VVREPIRVKLLSTKEIPAEPLVLKLPLTVVNPVPANCETAVAIIPRVETLLALEIVRVPRGVKDPIAPWILILPPPAASVRLPLPSIVLKKAIFCEAAEVSRSALLETVVAPVIEIAPPATTCPPKANVPVLF
jgi:hypothetical protein